MQATIEQQNTAEDPMRLLSAVELSTSALDTPKTIGGKDEHYAQYTLYKHMLRKTLVDFMQHMPEQVQLRKATKERNKRKSEGEEVEPREEFTRQTFHPCHIFSPKFKKHARKEIWKLEEEYDRLKRKSGNDAPDFQAWTEIEMEQKAEALAEHILGLTYEYEISLKDAFIPSIADFDTKKIRELHGLIDKVKSDEISENDIGMNEFIRNLLSRVKEGMLDNGVDEAWETEDGAKTALLYGITDTYTVWADFDGSKRPQEAMYSKQGRLLKQDINYGLTLFDNEDPHKLILQEESDQNYAELTKILKVVNALTLYLSEHESRLREEDPAKKEYLEAVMNRLKARRAVNLNQLTKIRNSLEAKQIEDGQAGKMIFLSKQVRYQPRLDYKSIEALKKREAMGNEAFYREASPDELQAMRTLEGILYQIVEMNHESQVRDCFEIDGEQVGDIGLLGKQAEFKPLIESEIIAQAQDGKDITKLNKSLNKAQDDYGEKCADNEEIAKKVTEEMKIILLLESAKTIDPANVTRLLNFVWNATGGKEGMTQRVSEMFYAASDSFREMGRMSARIAIQRSYEAVDAFNKEHGINIKLFFGTGESYGRSGGKFDQRAYTPMGKGKVVNPRTEDVSEKLPKLTEEELQETKEIDRFFTELFNTEWKEKLLKQPGGYNELFQICPEISFVTSQSRSREIISSMPPSKVSRLYNEARDTIRRNQEEFKDKPFPKIPEWMEECGKAETEAYQNINGAPDDKAKPQGNLSYSALIESIAKLSAMIRQRGLARKGDGGDVLKNALKKESEPGINSRAIGAVGATNFMHILGLVGEGAFLEKANEQGKLEEVLPQIHDLEGLLFEMKKFSTIKKDVYKLMEENGMSETRELLEADWDKLTQFIPDIQKEFIRRTLPERYQDRLDTITSDKKIQENYAKGLTPYLREMIDPDFKFESKNTLLFKEGVGLVYDDLANGIKHLKLSDELTSNVKKIVMEHLKGEGEEGVELEEAVEKAIGNLIKNVEVGDDVTVLEAKAQEALEELNAFLNNPMEHLGSPSKINDVTADVRLQLWGCADAAQKALEAIDTKRLHVGAKQTAFALGRVG